MQVNHLEGLEDEKINDAWRSREYKFKSLAIIEKALGYLRKVCIDVQVKVGDLAEWYIAEPGLNGLMLYLGTIFTKWLSKVVPIVSEGMQATVVGNTELTKRQVRSLEHSRT